MIFCLLFQKASATTQEVGNLLNAQIYNFFTFYIICWTNWMKFPIIFVLSKLCRLPPPDDPYLDRYERPLPPRPAPAVASAYPETSDSALDTGLSLGRGRTSSALAPVSYPLPRNGTAGQPQQTSLYTAFEWAVCVCVTLTGHATVGTHLFPG